MQRQQVSRGLRRPSNRIGSALVEFAVISPLFIAIILGLLQSGTCFSASQQMYSALRQAGRLATQDSSELLAQGQSINQKVVADIKNQLSASGINVTNATITITHADTSNSGTAFDLSDSNNDMKYFRIQVTIPFADLNENTILPNPVTNVSASIVFRKGKSTLTD